MYNMTTISYQNSFWVKIKKNQFCFQTCITQTYFFLCQKLQMKTYKLLIKYDNLWNIITYKTLSMLNNGITNCDFLPLPIQTRFYHGSMELAHICRKHSGLPHSRSLGKPRLGLVLRRPRNHYRVYGCSGIPVPCPQ